MLFFLSAFLTTFSNTVLRPYKHCFQASISAYLRRLFDRSIVLFLPQALLLRRCVVISALLPTALSARACARACLVVSFMALAQEVFIT